MFVTECVINLQPSSSSSHRLIHSLRERSQSSESQRSQMMESTKFLSSSRRRTRTEIPATHMDVPRLTTKDPPEPKIFQQSCKFKQCMINIIIGVITLISISRHLSRSCHTHDVPSYSSYILYMYVNSFLSSIVDELSELEMMPTCLSTAYTSSCKLILIP